MHSNYYFLRKLSVQLAETLKGFTLVSCFSQAKEELVIEFNDSRKSFFMRCTVSPQIQCLSFPHSFRRARKNSIDLFKEIIMKPVTGVRQFNNERSLGLQFADDYLLVFKMHGPQANVILFHGTSVVSIFRNHLTADRSLQPNTLDRTIAWSPPADPGEFKKLFFTFGKPVWEYLDEKGFGSASPHHQWEMVGDVRGALENPRFYLVYSGRRLRLLLLPDDKAVEVFDDPVEALNSFFSRYVSHAAFDREKTSLKSVLANHISQAEAYLSKARARLEELNADHHYTLWADLVMANLHRLTPGLEEVELEDFHDSQKRIRIQLRKALSPQKNAEIFYRKARNQAIEKQKLTEAIALREKNLAVWKAQEDQVQGAKSREDLEPLVALVKMGEKEKQQTALPYHTLDFNGYTILVGKNAAANDELTLHHANKDDLWLHARDVAGSHVVVRHQAGKNFPRDVITYAASLAAYHSKRRNDTLCPVSVTSVKYVRKRKGDPPGSVVVQREKVLMVEPWRGSKR